jgi:hypothetical protein
LHQPQVAGGIAGGAGAGTSPGNDTRDATHANADGIPVPGTNYQLVTSEDALATSAGVRAHERGHQMALGPYAASGINYTTRRGPDGQTIVTGGSIKADLSPVPGDPRATLRKASAVRGAALTPGDPSAADMRVAADAYRLAAQAKEELREERLNVQA